MLGIGAVDGKDELFAGLRALGGVEAADGDVEVFGLQGGRRCGGGAAGGVKRAMAKSAGGASVRFW